jgi:hypothetical protein
MSAAILLFFLATHVPASPYVLEYHCDSGWGDLTTEVCPEEDYFETHKRSFSSQHQAIDWADANFVYAPGALLHGSTNLKCSFSYLNPDSDDVWEAHKKDVDCGPQQEQAQKYSSNGPYYSVDE